jgi:two-component system phosphate regulon sensor histidine kinase PhoR
MKRFISIITIILLVIIALPVVFSFIKQASNLSENEALVQRVFEKQLETILFSVNQNSETLISSWVSKVDLPVNSESDIMESIARKMFTNNNAICNLAFYNIENQQWVADYNNPEFEESCPELLPPDKDLVKKLIDFFNQKYQRIESVRNGEFTTLFFVTNADSASSIGAITMHNKTFIDQNLRPGIQQISQDRFNIVIRDTLNRQNEAVIDTLTGPKEYIYHSDLWYLPAHKISIGLQTATITELVSERSQRDNYIFIGLVIIVLVGVTFVLFSIRREMKLAEMKSEFVSNVSHEIRTPLALISMYTETLLMKRVRTQEKVDSYLSIIHNETNRLASLVNQILSFSKMERNKRVYHLKEVDVNAVVQNVVDTFKPHFKKKEVECIVDLTNENTFINADKDAISEVIVNLIDNAVKYSGESNKRIVLQSKKTQKKVVVSIEDNGIGISSKNQKHIFDKFYRVTKGNLAHHAKGAGLGLNIVMQIMKHHQGEVKVESTEGKGSCFYLTFPVKK